MSSNKKDKIYERAGMDNLIGYGEKPALLVVDLQKGFTDPDSPLGGDLTTVVDRTNHLLEAAHQSEVPVVFTRIVTNHPETADLGIWGKKISTLDVLESGSEWTEIDDRLHVEDHDYILEKKQASAFHETELESMLTAWKIDTAIIAGCTTSGCIRATAIDACAHGYHTIVPEESVGDRAVDPHEANLFDIHSKYGDVQSVDNVVEYLSRGREEV